MKNRTRFGVSTLALFCAAGLAQAQDFPQSFDDITALTSTQNWFTQNNSSPIGVIGYFQGNTTVFVPQASAGYLGANFNSCAGTGTISNWFGTPILGLQNGQTFTFYTRDSAQEIWGDRLQVRLSTSGASTNVGTAATDVGVFTTLLLDINPTYVPANYPSDWQQFSIVLSGLPVGTTPGRIAFRYFVEQGGPTGVNSDYIGIDTATYDGSVIAAPTGACCLPNGACQVLTEQVCVNSAGVYGGNAAPCGTCPITGFVETTDVGDLPSTAQVLTGSGALTKIVGTIDLDDVDMYRINVCNDPTFSATTHGGPDLDSVLHLFNTSGVGLAKDDEGGASANHALVTGQFVPGNGEIYIAISTFDRDAADSLGQRIWLETNGGLYEPEWAPNGPGAANAVTQWINFLPPTNASYVITLTGACFIGGPQPCYANCDGTGGLTANDFICFLTAFNQAQSYANCDGVGGLTANDFICFVSAYNAGCS